MMNKLRILVSISVFIMLESHCDLNTTRVISTKNYSEADEYKKTKSIYYSMKLRNVNSEHPVRNPEIHRDIELILFTINDTLIRDKLLAKLQINLGFDERILKDTFYLKFDKTIFTLNVISKYSFPSVYSENQIISSSKSQSVLVNIPSSVQTVVNSEGKLETIVVPPSTKIENVTVPVTSNAIQTFNYIFNEIDFELNLNHLNAIKDSNSIEFRLYTDNGGISIPMSRDNLADIKNFLREYSIESTGK